MLVSLTSHLLSVLQADALTRRNAGEAASQRVVRGRYQAPPHAAVSNLGECVMVLGLLAMTAELQPHLANALVYVFDSGRRGGWLSLIVNYLLQGSSRSNAVQSGSVVDVEQLGQQLANGRLVLVEGGL
ncbi:hypothetical protein G039_0334440 [Pseudomonas aeruginosa VRFPA01]|nr:hypothetical protein G039_0334440 [Pseudomonas aeruginosa VRFPA01]